MLRLPLQRGFFFPHRAGIKQYCPVPLHLNKTGVFWTMVALWCLLKPGARLIFVRLLLNWLFLISEIIGFQTTLSLHKEGTTLAFEFPKQPYSGKIGTTTIGAGKRALTLGGEESYPFYVFEGKMPNPPRSPWRSGTTTFKRLACCRSGAFKDVISSPEAWAKKCVKDYGADLIVLQMKSIDPNGMDRKPTKRLLLLRK